MATDVAAPLPDVTLLPGATVTVDAGAGATVTQVVVHGFQINPEREGGPAPILVRGEPRSGR